MCKAAWKGVCRTIRCMYTENVLFTGAGLMREYLRLFRIDGAAMRSIGHVNRPWPAASEVETTTIPTNRLCVIRCRNFQPGDRVAPGAGHLRLDKFPVSVSSQESYRRYIL